MTMKDGNTPDPGARVCFGSQETLKQCGTINRKILGKWVSVFFRPGEPVYALEMSCKHHGANLAEGTVHDDVVTCPRHFWKYHLVTGASLTPGSPELRRHEVWLEKDKVYVSLHPMLPRSSVEPLPSLLRSVIDPPG